MLCAPSPPKKEKKEQVPFFFYVSDDVHQIPTYVWNMNMIIDDIILFIPSFARYQSDYLEAPLKINCCTYIN